MHNTFRTVEVFRENNTNQQHIVQYIINTQTVNNITYSSSSPVAETDGRWA